MKPSRHVRACAAAFALAFSLALTAFPWHSPLADTSNPSIFGPEVFQREQGKPQTYVRRFSVSNASSRFSLEVINGDSDDNDDYDQDKRERVSGVEIFLNDVQVVRAGDVKKEVRHLSVPVTLNQGDNNLKLTLKGDPVTRMVVSIIRLDVPPNPDLIPPRVIAVDPINGAAGVPINNAMVRVTFSEPILLDTLSPSSFYLSGGGSNVSGNIEPTSDRSGVVFRPAAPLAYSTTYTLTVTGAIKDLAGNALSPVFSSIFTTAPAPLPPPDLTPPRVISLLPTVGSINNQNSVPVLIRFSEAVDTSTLTDNVLVFADTAQGGGSVVILDGGSFLAVPNGKPVDGTVTASTDKVSATFTPTTTLADGSVKPALLPADATITVVVLTHVRDLAGNGFDQDGTASGQQLFSGSFTTSQFNWTGATSVARVNPQASRLEAALLPGDEVIVTGGFNQLGQVNSTADVYNRDNGSFHSVSMLEARAEHSTTVLDNGKVLIVGGIGANGQVLSSAELYDPATGTFTSVGPLNAPRFGHTATLLSDGTVLIAGGYNAAALDSCEVFIPAGNTLPFSNVFLSVPARMSAARAFHTATSLPGGYVLIAGGASNGRVLDTAEVFVPTPFAPILGQFISGSSPLAPWKMSSPRHHHTATALGDGRVLIAGGRNDLGNALRTAEVFTPSTPITLSSFSSTGQMTITRANHSATALSDGSVLIAGGIVSDATASSTAEVYRNGQFTRTTSPLSNARSSHAAVLLSDGTVLVTNGENGSTKLSSAETFTKRH